jgi:hypothetical protein
VPHSNSSIAQSSDAETRRPADVAHDDNGTDRAEAIAVRRQWMRLMNLDESEIEEYCGDDSAVKLEEEIAQLRAMERVKQGCMQRDVE